MLNSEKNIPITTLHEYLALNEATGELYWRVRPVQSFSPSRRRTAEHNANNWNSQHAGNRALNSVDGSGHLTGRIGTTLVYAHRVVFAMVHGYWPEFSIDHINGNPADNRPENLRDVPHIENHRNQRLRKNNTSGVLGVGFNKRLGKWAAHITISGIYKHLGFFISKDDAISTRRSAEVAYGFHVNHGRKMQ